MKTEIKAAFEYLELNAEKLTSSQQKLVRSLWKYYKKHKELSGRQIKTIFDMANYAV